jgi:hypothetical protein
MLGAGIERAPNFGPCCTLGEYEEADVGVEVLLKAPGDSVYLVGALRE